MDLSKAFDCLPNGLLVAKLHAYGLSTAACHLMFSYLRGRRQRVKISNSRSFWKLLTKGVAQGSILGPFLFNVFMNDLFLFIQHCKLYDYADDNSIIYSSPDINAILTKQCNQMVRRQQHGGKSRHISIHGVVIWPFGTAKDWNWKRHSTFIWTPRQTPWRHNGWLSPV